MRRRWPGGRWRRSATAIAPSLGAADRLPGPAGRGRVVQLARGAAGDGTDPAPVRPEPGQRDLQLGGRDRRGDHAGGRHAPDREVRLAVVVRGDRLGGVRLGRRLADPGPGRAARAAGPADPEGSSQVDPLEAGPARPRLPGFVAAAFVGVLLVGAAIALAGFRYGLAAVQVGIAVAIVGPLLVAVVIPRDALEGAAWAASLGEIVRNRRFWILVVVSITINICWHFLVNWIPSYLKQERGLEFEAGNYLSTIPFLAADAGNLLGRLAVAPARRSRAERRAGAAARHGRRGPADHGRRWASGWPRTSRPRSCSSR